MYHRPPRCVSDQPARQARLQVTLGKTYLSLGLAADAIPPFKLAQSYYESIAGHDNRDTLAATRYLGLAYTEAKRYDEAISLPEDLLARHRRLNGRESREAIQLMMDLGNSPIVRDQDQLAVRLADQEADSLLKSGSPPRANSH